MEAILPRRRGDGQPDALVKPADSMIQMNTRIDRELKQSGDEALLNAGFTPSQAVRALWRFAARHRHDPGGIRALLDSDPKRIDADSDEDSERRFAQARAETEKGAAILTEAMRQLGISSMDLDDTPYEELREQALVERLEERGLA